MNARDRRANLLLIGLAALAWLAVAWVLVTIDPGARPAAELLATITIGLALGATATPLAWLVSFARQRRIAYRGDWSRAVRRGLWVGGLAATFVLLRMEGLFQPQVAAFLVALVAIAEATLSARR